MNTIEQIKAEIERQEKQCPLDTYEGRHKLFILGELKTFLSTLESEKPIIPDGLDGEVHRFFEECIEVHEVPLYGKVKEDVITADCYEITARHFAKWGAERQKEQDLAEMAQSKSPLSVAYANRCFENGKQAMKEQLMKEAVEGYIERDCGGQLILGRENSPAGDEFMLLDSSLFPEIHAGRKYRVCIIIVKED